MKIFVSFMLCVLLIGGKNVSANVYPAQAADESNITSLVKPSPVYAEVVMGCPLYAEKEYRGAITGNLEAGSMVEILQDYSTIWYLVREYSTGVSGWVSAEFLIIPQDSETNRTLMADRELEEYVVIMGYESATKYLVFTDIDRQLTHVFKGAKKDWQLIKTFTCSTGKNVSPTTRGIFKVSDRGLWFYSERFNSGAKYWVRFNGSYLFHSVAMDKNKNTVDDVLGERRSSGCIRLEVDDAKWIFENIPAKTTVVVY